VSMTLCRVQDTSRYGRVRPEGERVAGLDEKGGGGPGWINAGVYLLSRQSIAAIEPGRALSLEREVLPELSRRGRVFGYRRGGRFLDIGTPESYEQAESFFAPAEEACGHAR